jgi:hypothetical protein
MKEVCVPQEKPVSGRAALVLIVFYPNRTLTAPQVWKNLQANEPRGIPRTFLSLSCGATYAAVRTCLDIGLLSEVSEIPGDARSYRLTPMGKTTAVAILNNLRDRLDAVVDSAAWGAKPV